MDLDRLIEHAAAAGDYEEIAPAAAALAASGDLSLVPRLLTALEAFLAEENFYGRDLVATVLAGIQGPAALPALLRASARDLGDDQDGLSTEIASLLEQDPDAARPIVLELVASPDAALRRTGLWALGFIAGPADNAIWAEAALDPDPRIRAEAIDAIDDPGSDERAFAVLIRAVRDPSPDVRTAAVSRLGAIRRPDAAAPLSEAAGDPSAQVRARIAYALGRLRTPAATPALRRLLDDPDEFVRRYALAALGTTGGEDAVDTLLTLAASGNPEHRERAAKALPAAAGTDPRVAPALAALAADREHPVRAALASGLASTGTTRPDWPPLLLALADDPQSSVRERVAVAVRHVAPSVAPDLLRRYADHDPDPAIRRTATVQLTRLP
ncbi:HEAT repeat domain-containing protein [Dactylosporangium sp. CA-233914]|uniref:HEAT repeat domain-containing protein n=1 Tax=Dactylosporangium sp. CA-233914 TaxID=3239934 RepID=UPI003D94A0A7